MKYLNKIAIGVLVLSFSACGAALDLAGSNGSTAVGNSDESETEAAFTSAIETLVDSSSSSSLMANSVSSNLQSSQYLASTQISGLRTRFRCDDNLAVTESFSCDGSTGVMTRTVTYEDCELSNSHRDVILNGSFSNAVTNGGPGMCRADNSIDFSEMVMGFENEEGEVLNAVHQHDSGDEAMVYSFVNARGKEVSVTRTSTRTSSFSNPIDENEDGRAETVTKTVRKEFDFVHNIDGEQVHHLTVSTTDESFTSSLLEEETGVVEEATIDVSLPVHTVLFNDEGEVTGRTIESGNLIVDHNVGQVRMVFGVGEEGLTFDAGQTCGPVSGTMTVVGYAIEDDGSIGPEIGTGTIVFEEGDVLSASFDGTALNLRPRPCY